MSSQYMSINAVAAKLAVHTSTVRRWVRDGKLKAVKAGTLHRIRDEDLAAFLRVSGTPPQQEPPL